jgi:Fe-S-cluster-containing hydrogenase component 2
MPCVAAGLPNEARVRPVPPSSGQPCAACPTPCAEACFNDAVQRAGATIRIDTNRCAGCGACIGACRHGCIALVQGVAQLNAAPSPAARTKHDGATDA